MSKDDLIRAAEIEDALADYIDAKAKRNRYVVCGAERTIAIEVAETARIRAAALRAMAGDEWVEVPRLD